MRLDQIRAPEGNFQSATLEKVHCEVRFGGGKRGGIAYQDGREWMRLSGEAKPSQAGRQELSAFHTFSARYCSTQGTFPAGPAVTGKGTWREREDCFLIMWRRLAEKDNGGGEMTVGRRGRD